MCCSLMAPRRDHRQLPLLAVVSSPGSTTLFLRSRVSLAAPWNLYDITHLQHISHPTTTMEMSKCKLAMLDNREC